LSEPLVSPEEYRSVVVREMGGKPRGLLRELSNDDASYLLKASHLLHCQPGTAIIRQGQTSRTVFLMLSGSLESRCDGHRIEPSVQLGELFGTAEFLGCDRRQFDVLAGPGGARVVALDDKTLRAILAAEDSLSTRLEERMQQESLSPVAV
ncbi:MAG: cyclic nucleotide-binding domain-containing protein, partial [Acidobacteriota bacterium]